jgi:hypothetical protein
LATACQCDVEGIAFGTPHWKIAVPQVRPAPNPHIATLSPGRIRPSAIASHRAIGIDAAEVFP